MWRMAALWERGGDWRRLAEQEIAPLAQVTGHAVTFTVPDGFYVRCIAAIDGHYDPLRAHPLVGDLYPAHACATSRAYFAFLDPMARRNLLAGRPFTRFTELTQIDPDAVDRLLIEDLASDAGVLRGEYDPTTRAIAAPVIVGNRPVGSMSVVEPKAREHERDLRDFVPALLEATASLADVLSNRPAGPAAARTGGAAGRFTTGSRAPDDGRSAAPAGGDPGVGQPARNTRVNPPGSTSTRSAPDMPECVRTPRWS